MASNDELRRENAALRERLAQLSDASARIAEELELDTVLREVLDAARSLTGARFSGITMLDEAGELEDFITPEFGDQEYQALIAMPGGEEFFRYLHGLAEPLRVDDLRTHVETLGLGPFPLALGSYLCLPIRRRGRHVGSIHLAEKRVRTASAPRTRRSWACSRSRRRSRSPTPAGCAMSSVRDPTWRP